MTEKQIARYQLVSRFAGLAMLVFGAIAAFDWLGKVHPFEGVSLTQIFAGLATLCGVVTRWAAGQLPASKPKVLPLGLIALVLACGLMYAGACKVPPLAMAYRGFGLLTVARDSGGEVLTNVNRARAVKCRADHPLATDKPGRIACLKNVEADQAAWVEHIKPAITATASTYWLACESAYVLVESKLDKSSKAAQLACAALTALEVTLNQYAAQLGKLRAVLLGAVSGGKVLICR